MRVFVLQVGFHNNKYRSQITDERIKQLLMVASAGNAPDFMGILAKKQCQGSHCFATFVLYL